MPDLARLQDRLVEEGLADREEDISLEALSGGVSCDVFRVRLRSGSICVKQALPRLKVAAEWNVSPDRSHVEAEWLRCAGRLGVPAPALLFEDRESHLFAMEFCDEADHSLWKGRLARGLSDPDFAAAVGKSLARMHRLTVDDDDIRAGFANAELFEALRIDPFLLHCARVHPELAERLEAIADETRSSAGALIHGDFSPKNILIGPDGPVILDAECATWGDPAFDLAFCTTHLLLKSRWRNESFGALVGDADAFVMSYRDHLGREAKEMERRAVDLVAALLLARVDGKSPVEYLDNAARNFVRTTASDWLVRSPRTFEKLFEDWTRRRTSE